ncbi:hypothetical protein TNCV_3816911 [Trichonephila clavipes]|nr:hypothetical protein TNCV_3816911 [Trichonephila clavipes]
MNCRILAKSYIEWFDSTDWSLRFLLRPLIVACLVGLVITSTTFRRDPTLVDLPPAIRQPDGPAMDSRLVRSV